MGNDITQQYQGPRPAMTSGSVRDCDTLCTNDQLNAFKAFQQAVSDGIISRHERPELQNAGLSSPDVVTDLDTSQRPKLELIEQALSKARNNANQEDVEILYSLKNLMSDGQSFEQATSTLYGMLKDTSPKANIGVGRSVATPIGRTPNEGFAMGTG